MDCASQVPDSRFINHMNTHPIGIIDSGSGGLSIWQSIRLLCPDESVVYVGDHRYLPYGSKSTAFIVSRMKCIIGHLLHEYFCKLIIVACNSATVAGIERYREMFPHVPIIGVVPVVKTASEVTKTGSIVVFATPYTIKSVYQKRLIERFAGDKKVYVIKCPKLVSYIEKGVTKGPVIRKILQNAFKKVLSHPVDVVVLGCTHYVFIKEETEKVLGPKIRLLDSGGAVARQTIRVMKAMGITSTKKTTGDRFLTTGDAHHISEITSLLTHTPIIFQLVTNL